MLYTIQCAHFTITGYIMMSSPPPTLVVFDPLPDVGLLVSCDRTYCKVAFRPLRIQVPDMGAAFAADKANVKHQGAYAQQQDPTV